MLPFLQIRTVRSPRIRQYSAVNAMTMMTTEYAGAFRFTNRIAGKQLVNHRLHAGDLRNEPWQRIPKISWNDNSKFFAMIADHQGHKYRRKIKPGEELLERMKCITN